MSMNDTPSGERIHIGFYGRRNAGKSSLVNAVTGQDLAVVSDVRGTTTDPVRKAMELLPLGPVVIIDTPGFDDEGALGELRIRKTRQELNRTDIAILVVDILEGMGEADRQLLGLFAAKEIPYLVVYNKADLAGGYGTDAAPAAEKPEDAPAPLYVSTLTGEGIAQLKERMAALVKSGDGRRLVGDLVSPGQTVILVVPIDKAAPKGRLILPQQQTIRDLLDAGAGALVVRETELSAALAAMREKPARVIPDSQVFGRVSKEVPAGVPLTSFSILMARYKGLLDEAVKGAAALDGLKDGDTVLIAEGCTHHRQCGDIGTVKIPKWLEEFTGKKLQIKTCSGMEFPEDLSPYALVIHCGGCMLSEREMRARVRAAVDQGVPITNYGTMIARVHGILHRSLEPFPALAALVEEK